MGGGGVLVIDRVPCNVGWSVVPEVPAISQAIAAGVIGIGIEVHGVKATSEWLLV